MKSLTYKLTGITTLLMHSDVTANPLNEHAKKLKALTSKRKKTDEDYERIAEVEFIAGIYYNERLGYYMPAKNIDATLLASAKQFKLGTTWKQAAIVDSDVPFDFPDREFPPAELYKQKNGLYVDMQTVKIGTSKMVRCRPAFNEWSFNFSVIIDEGKLNAEQVTQIVENAGKYIGICDYRPRYGKFNVEKLKS